MRFLIEVLSGMCSTCMHRDMNVGFVCLYGGFFVEQVMRKDDAVAEMITPPVLLPVQYHRPPPIQRPFPRDFTLRGALYPVRRPAPPMPYSGKSNLKWKRESSTAAGFQNGVHSTAIREMLNQGPVKSTRSLSYVRVAPYAIQGTRGSVQNT